MELDELAEGYEDWYRTDRGKYVGENEYKCLKRHIGECEGKKIIELGCGTGYFLRRFAVRAEEVVGFDITEKMLKSGKELAEAEGIEIEFIKGDVTKKLPFPDNYFDIVYSNSMIEFIDEDKIEEVSKEMWRILKKSGKLVIGVLNKESTWAYKRKAESLEKESIFSEGKFYTWEELESLLSKYGDVEMESTLFVPPYFKKAEDFRWFKPLEDEFKTRFPKRGALLVGSVEKKEDFDG
ncbi:MULTISPECIES: class I SAM-dependent methyltransferase [unclassified Halanaerobium]|jgi:ubiquinone/menaquinone biosynthesis C-methylase UbiE|uniref:class I SAM-dependent methyltransferase n=1 Tax=unclassified Halanaerobium TaxID=2641197 RepID=UPI000DF3D474|nr:MULTISPECIES: class I SAM-dependent methyltransferase [unclassified Halanaerobium]RCW44127.1 methyltransferase family protein [Halanaerobium sp. MA284_MarDTE_T2]RCW86985.1 methyltransferase family protein [Halanaerobium sp. DL-01]